MQKSRLIEILRTFSKKEFREFKKWLQSPAHNQRQDVVDLYEYLLKNENLFKETAIEKESVYPHIYPKEVFSDAKMRQVMHFMFKVLEEYLAFSSFKKKEVNLKLVLLHEYRIRQLDKNFTKTQKEIDNQFLKMTQAEEGTLYNKYLFNKEKYEYNSIKRRTQTLNLQELTDTFDIAFIAEKLKQACFTLAHQKVYNVSYNTGLLNKVLAYIESENVFENSRIGIYYYLYKITIDKNNTQDFFILKEHIQKNNSISKIEIRGVYLGAINFCIAQINSGDELFKREAFELYKNGIEKEIFIENRILSRWTFKNAIVLALSLKEYSWTEQFIDIYGKFVEEKYRESFIYFNMAKLFYAKEDYEKALELLNKYDFEDILVSLNAKTLLIKIYYELSEFKPLESLLESMRAYLQRKKKMMGNQHINIYKNTIRYTKKLLKVNPYNKEQIAKLRKEIEEATPLTEKTWLLKQVDEL